MHQALWLLTKLRFYASLRQLGRSLKTVRGVVALIFVVLLLGMVLIPHFLQDAGPKAIGSDWIRTYGPIGLLQYTLFTLLSTIGDKAIHFSSSEVDMLFSAPLTRKQLLVYKIINNLTALLVMSLFVSITNRMHYTFLIAGTVGMFLTLVFIQLLSMFTALVRQTVTQHAYTRFRKIAGIAVVAAIAVATSSGLASWQGTKLSEIPTLISDTTVGWVLLSPFRAFCNLIAAESIYPEFLKWLAISLATICALLVAIFRLDTNFNEVAMKVNQKTYDKLRRFQTGTVAAGNNKSTRIPMAPFCYGAGPLVWRQVVRMVRSSRNVLKVIAILVVAFSVPFWSRMEFGPEAPYVVVSVITYATFLMLMAFPAGFRADVERIEVFKSLPVPGWTVCVGQLLGPVAIVSLFHWVLFIALTILMPQSWMIWITAICISPLLNLLLLSISNGLFLLFPVQMVPGATPDIQTGLRNMMTFLMQMLALALALSVVAIPASLVFFATENVALTAITAVSLLVATDVFVVLFVCFAYERFDVTKHLPK